MDKKAYNKVYTVYTTKDGRKELKVCYATSTVYLVTEGEVTQKIANATLAKIGTVVDELERYDDVNQEWIESIYTELSHERQMEAEAFFPEIKENEDERIKKWCISHFKACINVIKDNDLYKEYLSNKVIAWLEKQDPKKFEEELEKAYKCADKVQYRNGYEDAKREILGMVDIESMAEVYKQRLIKECGGSAFRPVVRISVEAFKHGANTLLDELHLKQEFHAEEKLTETKGGEV